MVHVNEANDKDDMKDEDIIDISCTKPAVLGSTSSRNEGCSRLKYSKKGHKILTRALIELMNIGEREKGNVGVKKVRAKKMLDNLVV